MRWFDELRAKYTAGVAHCFLLHGAVDDYVVPGVSLQNFLCLALGRTRDLIVCYNIAEGITFPAPSMRRNCMRWLELTPPKLDPVAAALRRDTAPTTNQDDLLLPRAPVDALPLLERALTLRRRKNDPDDPQRTTDDGQASQPRPQEDPSTADPWVRCAVVISFTETLAPAADMAMLSPTDRTAIVTLQRWAGDKAIASTGALVVLLARDLGQIHSDVRAACSKIAAISLPPPDAEARRDYVRSLTQLETKPLRLVPGMTVETLATATAGLSLYQIEDVKLRADAMGTPVTLNLVKERKADIIRQEYHEVLEILEPQGGFDTLGGYAYVKAAFHRVAERLRRGRVYNLPKGILLLGPAGTGKTELAKALAAEAGVTCVRFNVGRVLGKYVGESESKLDRALTGLVSLAPCIAFMDELDQQTSRGESGGNDVEKRVFARLLEVMGDPQWRGKVLWVAASNRPDLIDAAIKRSGRLDYKIPVLAPDPEERLEILATQVRRHGAGNPFDWAGLTAAQRQELLTQTEGWTGAELEKVILKMLDLAEEPDGTTPPLTFQHLCQALAVIRPSTKNIEFMTKLALAEVDDLTLLPTAYRTLYDNRAATVDKDAEEVARARGPRTL